MNSEHIRICIHDHIKLNEIVIKLTISQLAYYLQWGPAVFVC